MDIPIQYIFGVISFALGLWSFGTYWRSILKGETRPHLFTWILWTLLAWIAYIIQVYAGAGAGSWSFGLAACYSLIILAYAIKHGDREYRRSDWIALFFGLMTIPLWIVTKDPTLSAILVATIDAVAYFPTIRKSFYKPREESLLGHALPLPRYALSIAAIEHYNIASTLYPVVLFMMNSILVTMIYLRRMQSKPTLS